jgi:hypothetical protein
MECEFLDIWKRAQINGEAIQILNQASLKLADPDVYNAEVARDIDIVIAMLRD